MMATLNQSFYMVDKKFPVLNLSEELIRSSFKKADCQISYWKYENFTTEMADGEGDCTLVARKMTKITLESDADYPEQAM